MSPRCIVILPAVIALLAPITSAPAQGVSSAPARPDPSVFQADLVRVLNAYHVRVPRDAASGPIAVVQRSIIGTYGPCQPLNVVLQVDRSGR